MVMDPLPHEGLADTRTPLYELKKILMQSAETGNQPQVALTLLKLPHAS